MHLFFSFALHNFVDTEMIEPMRECIDIHYKTFLTGSLVICPLFITLMIIYDLCYILPAVAPFFHFVPDFYILGT